MPWTTNGKQIDEREGTPPSRSCLSGLAHSPVHQPSEELRSQDQRQVNVFGWRQDEAVRARLCWPGVVADSAMAYRTGAPLPTDELDRIVGLAARGDRVRAVVAACAVYAAVLLGLPVQRLVLAVGTAVTTGVIASRFVEPWLWVL